MRASTRARHVFAVCCLIAIACLLVCAAWNVALAQGTPFGAPRAAPPAPAPDGVIGWILAKQAEFYRSMSALVRAAKADGSAVWTLLGVAFLYGIFHAAGPGHGKAVISAYLVANNETWRRGVVLSFASALVQALVAIAIVGVAAVLLGAGARAMSDALRWIEIVSYGLIVLIGARLLWSKGRALLAAIRPPQPMLAGLPSEFTHDHAHHHHDHAHHERGHHAHASHNSHAGHHHAHHDHAVSHTHHVHDEHCGHSHGPEPEMLAGPGGWLRGLAAVFAVGLRPCSGAILVLVFALAQGLFWTGIAATLVMGLGTAIAVAAIAVLAVSARGLAARLAQTQGGSGLIALRGLEVAAAALVLAFGVLLLFGYIASERLGMT